MFLLRANKVSDVEPKLLCVANYLANSSYVFWAFFNAYSPALIDFLLHLSIISAMFFMPVVKLCIGGP